MDYISGWCKSKRRLDGFTAIITGSNTGIGKETALDLYLRGARVIIACRDISKGEAARKEIEQPKVPDDRKGTLTVEKLDLGSLKSVREFAFKILAKEENIQILLNNAGVMLYPEAKTEDGFEMHIGTNHFGHAFLTLLLLPRLIKCGPSRIVCVSSYLHERNNLELNDINFQQKPYHALEAYCRSKAANVLFAKALAQKLKEHNITNVTTYSLHPGIVNTDIVRHSDKTVWYGASWAFRYVMGWFIKSPRCGAQTNIYCSIDEACDKESGLYYSDCAVKTPSKQCQNDAEAAKFWDLTIELLNINKLNYNPFGDLDPSEKILSENLTI